MDNPANSNGTENADYLSDALSKLAGVSASGPKNLADIAERIDHDSTHGRFPFEVRYRDTDDCADADGCIGFLIFRRYRDGRHFEVPVYAQPDPAKLPLKKLGVDVVIDATGRFLTAEKAQGFIDAGARKVLMSAPAKDDTPLIIYDINGDQDTGLPFVSLASCTTNAAAPIVYALGETFGYPESVFLNTTHAVTNSQKMLDGNSGKLENSFAGLNNIVVTDTGATKSLQKIFPELKQTTGIACRVPVENGSILCLVMEFGNAKGLTKESVLEALNEFGNNRIRRLLRVSHRQTMISSYVVDRSETSVVAPGQIVVIGGTVQIVAGYDNEYAYAYHLALAALNCPLPA
jgi:glyceraldehyde 3-phosphate dehydrogenase